MLAGAGMEAEANEAREAVIMTAPPIANRFFFVNFIMVFLSDWFCIFVRVATCDRSIARQWLRIR